MSEAHPLRATERKRFEEARPANLTRAQPAVIASRAVAPRAAARRPKILFVCHADNTHSQSWVRLLKDSEFDVRVFASPVEYGDLFPPQPWTVPTYTLIRPARGGVPGKATWLLPRSARLRQMVGRLRSQEELAAWWLKTTILNWKPDIIHTLRLNPEADLTWRALSPIPESRRPKWVVSSWGRELSVEAADPTIRGRVETVLRQCDGFMADCRRDLRLAKEFGLSPAKLAFADLIPGTGGLNLPDFADAREDVRSRNVVVIPKAYEADHNKTLPILEALRLAEDALPGYEVHLVNCSDDVRSRVESLPPAVRRLCCCHGRLSQAELFGLTMRARVMMAPSLSDGTPNVMLEAMAAGALPLMSPIDSIREWIEDGKNGLLAPALDPAQIAARLRKGLTDDDLWRGAREINRRVVAERADRERIIPRLLDYYRSIYFSDITK